MCLCFHVCLFFPLPFFASACEVAGEGGGGGSSNSFIPPATSSLTALLDSQLKLTGFNHAGRHFTASQEAKCSISCEQIQNEGKWAPKRDKRSKIHREEGTCRPDWVPTLYVLCLGLYFTIFICPRKCDKYCETC